MPAFELSKWYADCVTEEGDTLIIYHAQLRWRTPTIHYSSLLMQEAGRPAHSQFSLREQPAPRPGYHGKIGQNRSGSRGGLSSNFGSSGQQPRLCVNRAMSLLTTIPRLFVPKGSPSQTDSASASVCAYRAQDLESSSN